MFEMKSKYDIRCQEKWDEYLNSLSMLINLVAVTLSVLGLLNPTTGALVHNAGSVFVVLIATLLYDRKFEKK